MSNIVKINFECASCDKHFIVAYREDIGDDLPEYCPFCGDSLVIPQADDSEEIE